MMTYLVCPVCGRTQKIRESWPYPSSLQSINSWGPLVITEVCPECAQEEEEDEEDDNYRASEEVF